jgi:hypothetical protein
MSICHLDYLASLPEGPQDPFDEICCEDVGQPCVYCGELASPVAAFCSAECEERAYAEMARDTERIGPKAAGPRAKDKKKDVA